MPVFDSWTDLENLKIRFIYSKLQDPGFKFQDVYLDALWLEVEYDEKPKIKSIPLAGTKSLMPGPKSKMKGPIQVPPEIEKKKINFTYTDDNSEEGLIIKTDQRTYIGLTWANVYFSVTNIGDEPESVNLQVYFPENRGGVKKIEKWTKNISYQVEIPDYGPIGYFCEQGWAAHEAGLETEHELGTKFYQCKSTKEIIDCDSLSTDEKNCYLNNVQTGTHQEIRHKDDWQDRELSDNPLAIQQGFFDKLFGKEIKRKSIRQDFKVKKSTKIAPEPFSEDLIGPGQTQYFKMEINFPKDSSGEFYIEALGDKQGYGLLDPWWNSNWTYRKKLTFTQDSGQSSALGYMPILVIQDSSDTGFWSHVRTDGYDVRFLDDNDITELQFHFEKWNSTTDDMIAWVEVPSVAAYGTTDFIYLYYGNASAGTDPQNAAGTYDADTYFGGVWHLTEINAVDSTGNANTGTQGGTPEVVTTGQIGDAVNFIPTDYITFGTGSTIDFSNDDVFTVEFWANYDTNASDKMNFVQSQDTNSWNIGMGVYNNDIVNENYKFLHRDDDGTAKDTLDSGSQPPVDGTWHYYVGTYNNGASDYKALYIDGDLVVSTTVGINNLRPGPASLTIIGSGETAFAPFDGQMDEFRMSNINRSAQWIKAQHLSMTDAFINYGVEQAYGPVLEQNYFRWRDDTYGLNTNNGWLAAQNTLYDQLTKNTTVRLRAEIANAGASAAANYQYRIEYAARTGGTCGDETFTAVPATATSEHFEMVDSGQYVDGDNITSNFLTATGTWTNGKGIDASSNQTGNFSLTNDYYTEFEYAIKATSNALLGTSYCFRLTNAGATTNLYYIIYPQVTILSPTFTQNYYRFGVDNDVVQPTDPWPPGASNLAENAPITVSDSPPDDNDLVRIRMSATVSNMNLTAGDMAFKLQYAEMDGVDCTGAGETWVDLGASGSATIWRGESDSTPADGTTLTASVLTPSDVVESYEEENNSVNNPNSINIGQDGEWDWLVQNNGAVHDTTYCFRMVESNGTAFNTYTNYPKIATEATTFDSSFENGNGENFSKPYNSDSSQAVFDSELDGGTSDPICSAVQRQNWFYFSMNNALNQSIQFTMIDATANNNEQSNWTNLKPVYSYDQVTWYRISSAGSLSGNNFIFTAPGGGAKFTSDTVYIAYNIPYTYTDSENDITAWEASSYVTKTNIGNSVQSRAMYLLTIQDTNSPVAAADKKVYWFIARQFPIEVPGNWMTKGMIDFLIGDSDEAKLMLRSSIFKVIPMMNPDGAYHGWTRSNAYLCELNREWESTGANNTTEVAEVYNAHYYIDDWMNNGTPADAETLTDYHSHSSLNSQPSIYYPSAQGHQPYDRIWKIIDGNYPQGAGQPQTTTTMFSVAIYNQWNASKGSKTFTLEAPDIKFDYDWPTKDNMAAMGEAWLKANFAIHETNAKVFGLAQSNGNDANDPQYYLVSSPGQYLAVFHEDKGGGLYYWYDRENDSSFTNNLNDTDAIVDRIDWSDGTIRNLHSSTNAALTVENNSPTRVKFKYTGTLADVTNYDYTLTRVIWEDGRIWSEFSLTNNTGGNISWSNMDHGVSVDSGDAANFDPLYDNTADPPTQGTDNWWGMQGNGTGGVKAVGIGHYVGQTGGWVYDDYVYTSGTAGERNVYRDITGPTQGTGTSITVNLNYQIRPDNDILTGEAAIDVYQNDIANPDTPTMITGTFTEFNKQEGGLKFAASNSDVKFTYTNAATYTKKKPVYIETGYTANTAPVLKVNEAYLDGETGSAHSTDTHIGASYTSYVDTTNDIAYIQYLSDISTNINIETRDTFIVAPTWTVVPADSSDGTTPTNAGSDVTFTATASDPNADNYYLAVCKTNAVTAGTAGGAPTCDGGSWCITTSTVDDVQASCSYTTLTGDAESNDWYGFICDAATTATQLCSTSSNAASPFKVNHRPTFTWQENDGPKDPAVTITISTAGEGETTATNAEAISDTVIEVGSTVGFAQDDYVWYEGTNPERVQVLSVQGGVSITLTAGLTYAHAANEAVTEIGVEDTDSDTAADTVSLFVCKEDDFTGTVCGAGGTWCSVTAQTRNPTCSFTTLRPDGSYDYYPYVIDSHDFAATGSLQGVLKTHTVNNVAPSISASTIDLQDTDAAEDLTLLTEQGETESFKVLFTVTDENSCETKLGGDEIASSIIHVRRSGIAQANCDIEDDDNANNCIANAHNDDPEGCTQTGTCGGTTDTTIEWTCEFGMQYHADPTDGANLTDSTWWAQNWLTAVKATDDDSADTGLVDDADGNELASFLQFNLSTASIAYGALNAGADSTEQTTTLQATGNVGLDENLSGTDMTGDGTIGVAQQRYNLTAAQGWTLGTALSSVATEAELDVSKTTVTETPASANTYWVLRVPSDQAAGTYSGTNTFAGVQGEAQSW